MIVNPENLQAIILDKQKHGYSNEINNKIGETVSLSDSYAFN